MAATRPVREKTRTMIVNRHAPTEVFQVTGTYYNPVKGQCDDRPFETADGSIVERGVRWIALSRDMLTRWGGPFNYGDTVWVYHTHRALRGWWVVRDTMNKRWKKRMDFLVWGDRFPGKSNGVLISKSRIV